MGESCVFSHKMRLPLTKKLPLIKISAAGNRFLIADRRQAAPGLGKSLRSWLSGDGFFGNKLMRNRLWRSAVFGNADFEMFRKLSEACPADRKKIIEAALSAKEAAGADGLMVLDSSADCLECAFYNRDGSAAEMCGNAACCLAFYMDFIGKPRPSFRLGKTAVQTVKNPFSKDPRLLWGIALSGRPQPQGDFLFLFQGREISYTLISPGVPHAVIEWDLASSAFFPAPDLSGRAAASSAPSALKPAAAAPPASKKKEKAAQAPDKNIKEKKRRSQTVDYMLSLAKALRRRNPLSQGAGMNVSFFQILGDDQNRESLKEAEPKKENRPEGPPPAPPGRSGGKNQHRGRPPKSQKLKRDRPRAGHWTGAEGGEAGQNSVRLLAMTFERGVEGWTAACGTGALAAACAFSAKHGHKKNRRVFVRMPGGELMVWLPSAARPLGGLSEKNFAAGQQPKAAAEACQLPAPALFSPVEWGFAAPPRRPPP